ncbi:hypothetical protein B0H16DRAFT_1601359 [Mycena metata]|uniref:Transmembrane protein n=1 Tax=Mycena metata TaxID=1033252 RepID=A0AAD7HJ86_9AGAR|nr:hypothetical protein B0H16DRAFT_1601359 [Mycena metata]
MWTWWRRRGVDVDPTTLIRLIVVRSMCAWGAVIVTVRRRRLGVVRLRHPSYRAEDVRLALYLLCSRCADQILCLCDFVLHLTSRPASFFLPFLLFLSSFYSSYPSILLSSYSPSSPSPHLFPSSPALLFLPC